MRYNENDQALVEEFEFTHNADTFEHRLTSGINHCYRSKRVHICHIIISHRFSDPGGHVDSICCNHCTRIDSVTKWFSRYVQSLRHKTFSPFVGRRSKNSKTITISC